MTDLTDAIERELPRAREDLDRLVRVPSVSFDGFDPAEVRRSAEATAEILSSGCGLQNVRLLEVEGVHPAVVGSFPAPPGKPTVLLYAHHDVQPVGDESQWQTPPFEPVERDGRLFGRGTADDKGAIALHAAALRAHGGEPPVGVTVFVEGEEERGSDHLPEFLEAYRDELACDAIVLADSDNWRVGHPALTISLRGLADCIVEVRTLDHAVHSGFVGGAFPDALSALARLLATLHDDRGRPAIPGLVSEDTDALDLTEEELREQAGAVPGLELVGEGTLTSRIWTRPAISVLGIDAPPIQGAGNVLVPFARAKVSLRLAPGQDPDAALKALTAHLEANAPWGAQVTVTEGVAASPAKIVATGPAYDAARWAFEQAWGVKPVDTGAGGTIPFVAAFERAFPQASILITGIEDPDTRAHGPNESLHLGDWEKACLAEALLLQRLAEPAP